jgi:hypothetical protein
MRHRITSAAILYTGTMPRRVGRYSWGWRHTGWGHARHTLPAYWLPDGPGLPFYNHTASNRPARLPGSYG